MARTLHIVDPGFAQLVGHHRSMNELLAARAQARGWRVRVLAYRQVPSPGWRSIPLLGVFRTVEPYETVGTGPAAFVEPAHIVNDVVSGLTAGLGENLAPGDVVLAHSVKYLGALGLLLWAQNCPQPDVTLRLGFQSPVTRDGRAHFRAAARHWLHSAAQELPPPAGVGLEWVGYSQALADDLSALAGRPAAVVPPPIDYDRAETDPGPPVEAPVIAHLGGLRGEKGGALAFRGVQALLARRPELAAFIHDPTQVWADAQRPALGARCEICADKLAVPAFYRRIQASSAVLVPYDPEAYYLRTTHIGVEALGLARPVVTTDGTWLAEVLRGFDPMPGTIMAAYTIEGLVAATEALLADLPAKLEAAARAAPEIRARHDAGRVADRLIQPVAG